MSHSNPLLSPLPGHPSLADLSQSHADIISHLMEFASLPLLRDSVAHAGAAAHKALHFFREVIVAHHQREEHHLFPAVLASAAAGEELERVRAFVDRLTQEHRQVEALWERLEPALATMAAGHAGALDGDAVEALVLDYAAHASVEETEFLPLCRAILGRAHSELAHHHPAYTSSQPMGLSASL